ncbi:DUF4097 family beta strand repeat-containing protein [Coralloluteibacterium thermophilus]|uniref:DUF4097 domain-containing protein n=1 Tax=Coralloluteibacterium thermophilum TaxID=2707049 RepID=A0ABV9NI96_9GAMM
MRILSRFHGLPVLAALLALPLAALAQDIDERHPLAQGGRVEVSNVSGAIRVVGWDRDEVEIAGTLGDGQRLDVDASRDRVSVRVEYPRGGGSTRRATELRLRVPHGSELRATGVSARIQVEDVDLRRLQANSTSGPVDASGRAGEVALETVSGPIRAQVATERFSAGTVSGSVRAGGGIGGEVALNTVSGSIDLDAGVVQQLRGETVSGGMTLHSAGLAPGGRVKLETVSGRVALRIPADTSAQVRASSFSGRIASDAGEIERPRYGPGSSLRTTLGSGNGDIALESFSGSVRLELVP